MNDFNPKPHNSTHEKLFQDSESHFKGQPKKCWSRLDSQLTSETAQSPTDNDEGHEQTQPQDEKDALNQTVVEILSSLSEKSNPRIDLKQDKENSVHVR